MSISLYDAKGRVVDPGVAEIMAHAEKPYHENKLAKYCGFFKSRVDKILISFGQTIAGKVGEKLYEEKLKGEDGKEMEEAANVLSPYYVSDTGEEMDDTNGIDAYYNVTCIDVGGTLIGSEYDSNANRFVDILKPKVLEFMEQERARGGKVVIFTYGNVEQTTKELMDLGLDPVYFPILYKRVLDGLAFRTIVDDSNPERQGFRCFKHIHPSDLTGEPRNRFGAFANAG